MILPTMLTAVPVYKDLIYIDWTLVFTICNTLILFLVLKHFFYNKVKKILDDRKDEVEKIYLDADTQNQTAIALKSSYEEKLAVAKETASEIVKDATVKAQARGEQILTEANQKASATVMRANEQIEQDKKKAINEIKNDITDLAMSAAARVVDKELNADDHRKLIEEFIDNTGDIKWQN